MSKQDFGRCAVCELRDLEVDDGGFLFCPGCGARENSRGWFVPTRMTESDYHGISRSFESCPFCGQRDTTRDTDDFVYCFRCLRVVVLPAPECWYPPGAICRLDFRCELPISADPI